MNTNDQCIRIVLVDDHPTVRDGLTDRIDAEADMEVCGEASCARDAIALIDRERPDVVILDIALKDSDGLDVAKALMNRRIPCKIIFHSMYDEATYAERCLNVGAMGYVNKESSAEEVITAIREVVAGNIYLSRELSNRIMSRKGEKESNRLDGLTNRQLEIFRLIGQGKGTSEIAKQLHLSIHTIETHRENIKHKLCLRGSGELMRAAVLWANQRSDEQAATL